MVSTKTHLDFCNLLYQWHSSGILQGCTMYTYTAIKNYCCQGLHFVTNSAKYCPPCGVFVLNTVTYRHMVVVMTGANSSATADIWSRSH